MVEQKGFIRTGISAPVPISREQKAQLLRRGNEFFNAGNYDMAAKIFTTLRYTDGLIRLGDTFYKQGDFQKAATFYLKAPAPAQLQKVCKRMAEVVRLWMSDGNISQVSSLNPPKAGKI
jgi:hypothetical protein